MLTVAAASHKIPAAWHFYSPTCIFRLSPVAPACRQAGNFRMRAAYLKPGGLGAERGLKIASLPR